MDMTGEYLITAPRAKVWSALNDPVILKQCIAGCEELLKTSDTEFAAKVQARVGPVSAHFSGKVTLSELDPPNGYRISGEGSGGAAGFAKGGATVHLSDSGAATKLTYKVEAQIGGKLAQIGSRLIDGTARKMADDFFAKFAALVGAPAVAAAPASASAPAAAPSPAQAPVAIVADDRAPHPPTPTELLAHQEGRRLPPILWVTILAALVAGVLYFFVH
ncbi:MAG TPA: carbon monoxide dehydrogenase subunit G [Stellaceae bacterium]|nr:carbon monoxide dehydrogenase subunit G [Stellaceae bacterium]